MASGRQVEYSLRLNSNASSVLNADAQAANKFDNSMWQVQKTLASFGLGLGAHFMIDAAKDWTQAAADYEQAMLRIKNASQEGFGAFNEKFINDFSDKFKVKLQEVSDSYGKFLFYIKNAHLSNGVQNDLFTNLGIVGKIGGLDQGQLDLVIKDVSVLLGEGVLTARQLRGLAAVHPQYIPFLAARLGFKDKEKDEFEKLLHEEEGETSAQKLNYAIATSKLTKMGINSNVLIPTTQDYADSLGGLGGTKLAESLDTLNSHLADLSNTWLRFKNSMSLGQKPELLEFIHSLENGIKWLTEHEEGIIRTAKGIFHLVEAYAAWRGVIMLIGGVNGGFLSILTNEQNRLNTALGVGNKLTKEQTIINDESSISYASMSEKHTIFYEKDKALKEQRVLLLEQTNEQEQLLNNQLAEIQETYYKRNLLLHEWYNEREASLYVELEAIQNKSVQNYDEYLANSLLVNEKLIEAESIYNAKLKSLKEEEFNIVALNNEKILETQNYFAKESAAISEKMIFNQSVKNTPGAASNLEGAAVVGGGLGRGLLGFASNFIMGVFIADIANDALNKMFPKSKDQWDTKDVNQAFGMQGGNWNYRSEYKFQLSQGKVNLNDPYGVGDYNQLDPIWVDKETADRFLKNQKHPLGSSSENWGIGMFGNETTTNPDLYSKYINPESSSNKGKNIGIPDHKLLGNSSNYFTVHIDTLNGIQKVDIKEASKNEIENIKAEVGVQIARNLTEIINDVQLIRNGH